MMSDFSQYLNKVINLAKEAGDIILECYHTQNFSQHIKSDQTPVTTADLKVHAFLHNKFSLLTPHIPVLSEEDIDISFTERSAWETYWLIDPIDGTREFIDHTGDFSVMIALVHKNQPVLGIVYSPVRELCFYACSGGGAWVQEKELEAKQLHNVQTANEKRKLKFLVSPRFDITRLQGKLTTDYEYEFEKVGSASLKSCMIAAGKADAYLRLGPTGEWDTAATTCILKEVGGEILDLHLQPLTYNQRESLENPAFIALKDVSLPWDKILGLLYKGK